MAHSQSQSKMHQKFRILDVIFIGAYVRLPINDEFVSKFMSFWIPISISLSLSLSLLFSAQQSRFLVSLCFYYFFFLFFYFYIKRFDAFSFTVNTCFVVLHSNFNRKNFDEESFLPKWRERKNIEHTNINTPALIWMWISFRWLLILKISVIGFNMLWCDYSLKNIHTHICIHLFIYLFIFTYETFFSIRNANGAQSMQLFRFFRFSNLIFTVSLNLVKKKFFCGLSRKSRIKLHVSVLTLNQTYTKMSMCVQRQKKTKHDCLLDIGFFFCFFFFGLLIHMHAHAAF